MCHGLDLQGEASFHGHVCVGHGGGGGAWGRGQGVGAWGVGALEAVLQLTQLLHHTVQAPPLAQVRYVHRLQRQPPVIKAIRYIGFMRQHYSEKQPGLMTTVSGHDFAPMKLQ
jgi:hypothetical protein